MGNLSSGSYGSKLMSYIGGFDGGGGGDTDEGDIDEVRSVISSLHNNFNQRWAWFKGAVAAFFAAFSRPDHMSPLLFIIKNSKQKHFIN
jgi:hypothetical protein